MPPKGEKRVAPISSSAFSFSLGTPAKKKHAAVSGKPVPHPSPGPVPNVQRLPSKPSHTSQAAHASNAHAAEVTTPIRTAARPASVSGLQAVGDGDTTPKKRHQPQQQGGLPSPFLVLPQTTPRKSAGISSISAHTTESPKRAITSITAHAPGFESPRPDHDRRINGPLGFESPKRPERRINDVLDASPFRVKPAPVQLQNITAPPAVAIRERERVVDAEEGIGVSPRKFKGNIQYKGPGPPPSVRLAAILSSANTAMVLFYTAQQHAVRSSKAGALAQLRTAPVRLEVLSAVDGRTHAATMLRCRVRCWPAHPAPDTLIVAFQTLPADCPLVGVDPRVVASNSAGKKYEVGVWSPWTDAESAVAELGCDAIMFASRYLLAESV